MHTLFIGNETYLSLKNAKIYIKELLKEGTLEYVTIDGEKTDSSRIIDTLSSQSLFNLPKVIFLKRPYKNKDRENLIPFLLEYLKNNSSDSVVIWEDQKISSITKYVKYFKINNTLREYNKLTKPSFNKYAKELALDYGMNISPSLITLLSQYSNFDTERLENNILKLKLLGKESISKEDIQFLIQDTLEQDIWKLLDEMNSKDGKPLIVLEKILTQKVDPKYILPMIIRNIRLITEAKYLTSNNYNYSQIASVLRIPPFTVSPIVQTSKRYDWEKIKSKYEKLSNLDYEIKIGRIDPKLGLTLFCTTM